MTAAITSALSATYNLCHLTNNRQIDHWLLQMIKSAPRPTIGVYRLDWSHQSTDITGRRGPLQASRSPQTRCCCRRQL